jgi:hypothetical protein
VDFRQLNVVNIDVDDRQLRRGEPVLRTIVYRGAEAVAL